MKTKLISQRGFSFAEALLCLALIPPVVGFSFQIFINQKALASYARHKSQAMFIAQQIIEEQRRLAFSTIASKTSAVVTLDTKGSFGSTTDDFTGNRIITVTSIDANKKLLKVEINWIQVMNAQRQTIREYYATIIANEPQLN